MGLAAARSKDATPEWDLNGGLEEDDGTIRIGHAQNQHFRTHRTELSRWKVEDGDDQLAAQRFRTVVHRQLGARASDAKRSKIDAKLVGWLAGFWKGFGLEDAANPHVDPLEVRDID